MTPKLVAISDRHTAGAEATLERFAELGRLARPKSVVYQLRDLELGARERLDFGRALLGVARETGQFFVVNDRVDLAVLLGADGVHLGVAGMDTADARRLLGEHTYVSRACHDPARIALLDADAVLLSPILESRKGRPALGLGALRKARELAANRVRPLRIVALGGISSENASTCLLAGADAIAAVGAVLRPSEDLPTLVRALGIER